METKGGKGGCSNSIICQSLCMRDVVLWCSRLMILNRVSREIDTAEGSPGMELVVHLLNLLSCFIMFTEQSRTLGWGLVCR